MLHHSGPLEQKWNRQLTRSIVPAGAKNAVWEWDYVFLVSQTTHFVERVSSHCSWHVVAKERRYQTVQLDNKMLTSVKHVMYHSLAKEEHITSLPIRGVMVAPSAALWGVGTISSISHLTTKVCPCHVYSDSMPLKQIVGQTVRTAEPPAASKSSPDDTQHSEHHHVTVSMV